MLPAPGTGGTVRVQAIDNACGLNGPGPQLNTTSKPFTTSVVRSTPTLTVISDKSPNGGDFTLTCGDQSDYHFRATNSTLPAGGTLDNYVFSFDGPITPTGNQSTPTPVTHFTGATGKVVGGVSARYSRNGASTAVGSLLVNVTVQQLPKPVINSPVGQYAAICLPTNVSASVAGATKYTWTATGGFGVGAPGAATLTTASNQVTIYPGTGSGQGTVTVTAQNDVISGCASPGSDALNLVFGSPANLGGNAFTGGGP